MYAQVRKSDNVVSLIGGAEVGLPIEHPDVLCIDIGENKERIEVNWTYDSETNTFKYIPLVVENHENNSTENEQGEHALEDKLTALSESVETLYEKNVEDSTKFSEALAIIYESVMDKGGAKVSGRNIL